MTKYCFKTDGDCHWYMIPEELSKSFEAVYIECLEIDEWSEFEYKFNEYRIDSPMHYTFENPEEI